MTWCLIKIGKAYAFEDRFCRDMRFRLLWESEVMGMLSGLIPLPKVLAQYTKSGYGCLVLDWLEGEVLPVWIKRIKGSVHWEDLEADIVQRILGVYAQVLQMVATMHAHGFIHRDITPSNIMVTPGDHTCFLDFELTYNWEINQPDPPFLLGTEGYISSNQRDHGAPKVADDIYALGAVLIYIVSGEEPGRFIHGSLIDEGELEAVVKFGPIREMLRQVVNQHIDSDEHTAQQLLEGVNALIRAYASNATVSDTLKQREWV